MSIYKKKTNVVVNSINHPFIVNKRNIIEKLLMKLPNDPSSNRKNKIKNIQGHMSELKKFNKILERKHLATIATREVKITNTKI